MAMAVGKAQGMVLDALHITAWDNVEAANFFTLLGLRVTGKRIGKTSIPQITVEPRGRIETRSALTSEGEGDTWDQLVGTVLPIFDMTAIMEWVVNKDEAERITALAIARHAPMPTRESIKTPDYEARLREQWAER